MTSVRGVAYAGKKLGSGFLGRSLNQAAKYAAGCYFDFFCKRYRTEGLTFEIPREQTTRAMRGRFAADTYELPERNLVREHLPPDSRVLELGGCIGVVSCLINKLLADPRAHVVVEANPRLIPALTRNRELNGAVFSIEHCVVSRSHDITLSIAANMDGSKIGATGVSVPARTLESIEASHQIEFDSLIMDIEGAESDLIRENKLTLQRLRTLMVEFHPATIGEEEVSSLRQILMELGLQLVERRLTTEFYRRP